VCRIREENWILKGQGAQSMLSKYVFGDIDFICVLREHCTELGTKELQTLNERVEVYNSGK
jgi:hypothetical protein